MSVHWGRGRGGFVPHCLVSPTVLYFVDAVCRWLVIFLLADSSDVGVCLISAWVLFAGPAKPRVISYGDPTSQTCCDRISSRSINYLPPPKKEKKKHFRIDPCRGSFCTPDSSIPEPIVIYITITVVHHKRTTRERKRANLNMKQKEKDKVYGSEQRPPPQSTTLSSYPYWGKNYFGRCRTYFPIGHGESPI